MTATLQLTRTFGGITNRGKWQILIDGTAVGSIDQKETVELPLEPGPHTLRVKRSERFLSRERSFDAADEQAVRFSCHSQLLWPMYIASLVKPELWITLRRD
ncbi:MAG TPA: hypothetical protein VKU77_02230 [Streptosporangiaceae bacterium]|nr:hypothetical protein [Streptosporangiaceae bacterium]